VPDAVLDPGVGAVAGFEEGQLLAGSVDGVGREGLVAPPVGGFEQGQLRTGVRVFATHDDPHPGRPARQVEHAGQLHDIAVLADLPGRVDRWGPGGRGDELDGVADPFGDGETH